MRNRGLFSIHGGGTAAAMALWLAATPAAAAQQIRNFDISAGDLGRALNAFARQANREIIFSSAVVAGKRTKGVRGKLDPNAALQVLLQGTGLRVEGGAVLTLRKIGDPQPITRREATVQDQPFDAFHHVVRDGLDPNGRDQIERNLSHGCSLSHPALRARGSMLS